MMRLFSRRRTDDDFADEIQAHIALETDRLIADGMDADDARAAAVRAFGNVAIAKERFYETSRWVWLDQLRQDLRYAWRSMRRSPAFLATTVLTLAVGLGLLTVAFTVFNAYVLRPFAIRDPQSLHQIVWHAKDAGGQGFRWRDYDELSRRSDVFAAVVGEHTRFVSAANGRPLLAGVVSPNYFEALGPAIQRGRAFGSGDAEGGDVAVAVLADQAWARLYDRDPAVLGRAIELNGRAFTVVGILAPEFTGIGDESRDVFVPVSPIWTAAHRGAASEPRETEILVRLRDGVSAVQAETAITPFLQGIFDQQARVRAEVRPQASPNMLSLQMIAVLSPAFAAFVLVLVTACANVSNVMLARAVARHRELAVRLSIGASRERVVRQLLTEGLSIAVLAGAVALALAAAGLRAATAAFLGTLPPSVAPLVRLPPLTFDVRVFLFALAAVAAATLLFALLPALQASRLSLSDVLRGQGGAARRGSRLRNALVVGQVAVAIVLVILAATIGRNGAAIGAMDVGFETAGVVSINVRGGQGELARPLAEALAADPRVAQVAVTSGNPLFNSALTVAAAPADASIVERTRLTFVSPEFFSLLRLPIARGRAFSAEEASAAAPVAIVSQATADALWPGQDPIGKTLEIERAEGRAVDELPDYPAVTVVGAVRDIVTGLIVSGRDAGHIYLPMTATHPQANAILLRGRTDRELRPQAFQEIFRRVAPEPEVFELLPLGEMRDLQTYPLLAASWIGSLLGAIALALSLSGLYGVLTYALSQRQKEIGIRMALGAAAGAVVAVVVRQSTRLAGIGALIGTVVAFAAFKVLDAAIPLEAISLLDLGAFAAGLAVVMATTALAAYQPARRAARVNPCETLRADV